MKTGTTSYTRRTTVIATLVLLAVMVLGACGDGDASAEPAAEPTAVPTTPPTPTVEPTAVPTTPPTPTVEPTAVPTTPPTPTVEPTAVPTMPPTPTVEPTAVPTMPPTPTVEPTAVPTMPPTPTVEPTAPPTTPPTPTFSVTGFVVADGERARLCELLAESFPPQCGGTSYDLIDLDLEALTTTTAQGVTWTDQPVTITGTIDGPTLTVIDVTPGQSAQVTLTGFVVVDGERARLCELLAESFPPQCGGTSYDLIDLDLEALTTTTAQGVTWTDQPVTITGTIDGPTLTVIDVDE